MAVSAIAQSAVAAQAIAHPLQVIVEPAEQDSLRLQR